ncbi:MAG: helix-turn-helix domain-containing protein [Luteolibacter sp.]|uniref:helix-turn-helix domain-containing protein n=1 Tax=Luteolibacter sp. TaxID=1962973 RepID=UPI0032642F49
METPAYTPQAFARLFGKEKTWTYRMVRKGKLKGITDMGDLRIPASEVERLAKGGQFQLEASGGDQKAKPPLSGVPDPGKSQWGTWLRGRREGKAREKSVRPKRFPESGKSGGE